MPYADVSQALAARPHPLAVPAEPRRQVEVRLRRPPRRPGHRLLPHRRRRQRLGHHPGPLRLAAARLRLPDLRQHHLPLVGPQRPGRGGPAARPPRPATTPSASTGAPSPSRADWAGRRTFLHFEGVKSAHYVWINGELVGYREDSYTPAEYDITPHLKPGTNQIAVEVYRYSDGDWLEDQDMIRLSGIFRSVYLYSTPGRPPARLQAGHPAERRLHGRRAVRHRERARLRRPEQPGRATPSRPSSTTRAATPSGPARCSRPSTSVRRRRRGRHRTGGQGRARARSCGRPSTRTSTPPCCGCATRPAR